MGKTDTGGYEQPMNASHSTNDEAHQLYKPLQAASAETTFMQFKAKLDNWITSWNDNPDNRSKIGQLREQLEETKAVVIDDLEQTVKRGQLLEETREKSESLVAASSVMKKRSKEVKVKMCCRKYMYWLIGFAVTVGFALFLYLLLR